MLSREQIELIQQEIDGANTPAGSAAVRSLLAQDPEATAMAAELRRVAALFGEVAEREPPARLKRAILDALPQPARASPGGLLPWVAQALRFVTTSLEEPIMTRKAVLIGSTAAAVVLVVAGILTGFPPGSRDAGTIGGVQPAARYHGKVMTEADVSLKNPEIQALFQNDKVLHLVRTDAFRQVMASDAFRQLQANATFRQLMASDAFRQLMEHELFRQVMENDLYRQLLANEAFRQLQESDASRQILASDAFRQLQAAEAFRAVSQSQALSHAFMREAMRAQM